ncbi:MAG: hypothetical protein JF590_08970 [Gemmatimonadetes bacterium]|jgi:hypothetical protein|nr:hypothetical protein [Gemmatimonadota bacterium]
MRFFPLLLLTLTLGVPPLAAQGPGGYGGGMGGRGMGGGRPMMSRRAPAEPPSEDLIRGPYHPDSMATKFALDSAQSARYRTAWDSMMTATAPTRDSVRATLGERRRARVEGFQREGAREDEVLQKLVKTLQKDEDHFDKVMKKILTKDQWGDFKDWRARRRATEREMREQQRMDGPEGGAGGRQRRH